MGGRTFRANGPRERAGRAMPGRDEFSVVKATDEEKSPRPRGGGSCFGGEAGLTWTDGAAFSRFTRWKFLLRPSG